MQTLILGEALVDLVCEQPVAGLEHAPALVPHPGGAGAALALATARAGGDVALAAATGDDPWGTWLADRLAAGGVTQAAVGAVAGARTGVAWVTADAEGATTRLPPLARPGLDGAAGRVAGAVQAAGALCVTTGTLVEAAEREATQDAVGLALELERTVVFVPALEPGRWEHPGRAITIARDIVPGACVLLEEHEARALSGEGDPVRAADALLAAGARAVAVDGAGGGAWIRGGGMRRHVPAVAGRTIDATGAHAAWAGVLLARLAGAGGYPPALAAALEEAAAARAAAAARWGAA